MCVLPSRGNQMLGAADFLTGQQSRETRRIELNWLKTGVETLGYWKWEKCFWAEKPLTPGEEKAVWKDDYNTPTYIQEK